MISRFLHSLLALGLVMTTQLASAGAPVSNSRARNPSMMIPAAAAGPKDGSVE